MQDSRVIDIMLLRAEIRILWKDFRWQSDISPIKHIGNKKEDVKNREWEKGKDSAIFYASE